MAVETVLNRQENRLVLHLLNYANRPVISWSVTDFPETGLGPMQKSSTIFDEILPIHNITIKIRSDKSPVAVYRIPDHKNLDFTYQNNVVEFTIDVLQDVGSWVIE